VSLRNAYRPAQIGAQGFVQRLNDTSRRVGVATFAPAGIESQNRQRLEALLREAWE
jgi:uncharacterized protein YaiI (UPF0178 family)